MITIYSKPACPNCDKTKLEMNILGITYRVVDVTEDVAARDRLVAAGYRSLPVVDAGDAGAWSGHDSARIKALAIAKLS